MLGTGNIWLIVARFLGFCSASTPARVRGRLAAPPGRGKGRARADALNVPLRLSALIFAGTPDGYRRGGRAELAEARGGHELSKLMPVLGVLGTVGAIALAMYFQSGDLG